MRASIARTRWCAAASSERPRWVMLVCRMRPWEATEQVMSKQPGYLAANIHRSLDGTKVTNYAHWRSPQDFQALARNPEVAAHMRRAQELAIFEPALYEVVFTHHA
jgi:hypothetical protein